jgi:hypothetical protein
MVDTVGAREPQSSGPGPRSGMQNAALRMRRSGITAAGIVLRVLVRVVWAIVGIVNLLVMLDFVFRLIGARDEGFAHAVFAFGSTLASPFDGIFANVARLGGYALRWSDLVVIVLCTVAGLIVTRTLALALTRKRVMG